MSLLCECVCPVGNVVCASSLDVATVQRRVSSCSPCVRNISLLTTYTIDRDAILLSMPSPVSTIDCMAIASGSLVSLLIFLRYERNCLPLRLSRYSKYDDDVPRFSAELLRFRFSLAPLLVPPIFLKGIGCVLCIDLLRAAHLFDPRIIVKGADLWVRDVAPKFSPPVNDALARTTSNVNDSKHLDFIALVVGRSTFIF